MSVAEFLAWEREQPERYEYAGGLVTMMTGASLVHVTITMNIAFALRQSLRGSGCRPFTNDAKVLAGGSVRYPDITVTCTPFGGKDDIVPDPIVVIEVISPSTEREDRGRKKFDYFATPSIHVQVPDAEVGSVGLFIYPRLSRRSSWLNPRRASRRLPMRSIPGARYFGT